MTFRVGQTSLPQANPTTRKIVGLSKGCTPSVKSFQFESGTMIDNVDLAGIGLHESSQPIRLPLSFNHMAIHLTCYGPYSAGFQLVFPFLATRFPLEEHSVRVVTAALDHMLRWHVVEWSCLQCMVLIHGLIMPYFSPAWMLESNQPSGRQILGTGSQEKLRSLDALRGEVCTVGISKISSFQRQHPSPRAIRCRKPHSFARMRK